MLKISRSAASDEYTNLMSFHAGRNHGPMIIVDQLSSKELKHYAMIGLEKTVRDALGCRCNCPDLTPEEVQAAVEALFLDEELRKE